MIPETFTEIVEVIRDGVIHTYSHPGGFYFSWLEPPGGDPDPTVYEMAILNSHVFKTFPELYHSDIPDEVWKSFKEQTKGIAHTVAARQVLDKLLSRG